MYFTLCSIRYVGTMINNSHGSGSGPIWLDDVSCVGIERDIYECSKSDWGSHNCSHSQDVSISCGKHTSLYTCSLCTSIYTYNSFDKYVVIVISDIREQANVIFEMEKISFNSINCLINAHWVTTAHRYSATAHVLYRL